MVSAGSVAACPTVVLVLAGGRRIRRTGSKRLRRILISPYSDVLHAAKTTEGWRWRSEIGSTPSPGCCTPGATGALGSRSGCAGLLVPKRSHSSDPHAAVTLLRQRCVIRRYE